jgi:hypothetical protein
MMRFIPFALTALLLFVPASSFAQEWVEYSSRADRFFINFPVEPKVQDISWLSEYEAQFPARVYTAEQGPSRYSVTAVDYTNAAKIHAERAKSCDPVAHPGCRGTDEDGAQGAGSYKYETRGAPDYVSSRILQRDGKVTYFAWAVIDRIEGKYIHMTNADRSRTFFGIYMHDNRLYITEATVPAGYPEPGLFQQSLRFLDENGNPVRYQTIYTNGFPAPPRAGGGRGRGAGPAAGGVPRN